MLYPPKNKREHLACCQFTVHKPTLVRIGSISAYGVGNLHICVGIVYTYIYTYICRYRVTYAGIQTTSFYWKPWTLSKTKPDLILNIFQQHGSVVKELWQLKELWLFGLPEFSSWKMGNNSLSKLQQLDSSFQNSKYVVKRRKEHLVLTDWKCFAGNKSSQILHTRDRISTSVTLSKKINTKIQK